jgi:hypothetical protein
MRSDKSVFKGIKFYREKFRPAFGPGVKVRFVTRADGLASRNPDNIPVIKFEDFSKAIKDPAYFYSVSDFVKESPTEVLIDDTLLELDENGIKEKSIVNEKHYAFLTKGGLEAVNASFKGLKIFLGAIDKQKDWNHALFDALNVNSSALDFYFWKFPASIFSKYLNLDQGSAEFSQTIFEYLKFDDPEILFNEHQNKTWGIKIGFFFAISQRLLPTSAQAIPDFTDIAEATRLYILHELLHQIHKLDHRTVDGIGNFPRIVEEVDYQADAFAMMSELAFFIHTSPDSLTVERIKKKILNTIRIAVQTTFSFNPIDTKLKAIQVRRANRYLIWFFQYKAIETLFEQNEIADYAAAASAVLAILSKKPIIEFTGPEIFVNKDKNRVLYNLDNIVHPQAIGLINGLKIERHGNDGSNDFPLKNLLEGLRESDFKKIYDYIDKLFYSKIS